MGKRALILVDQVAKDVKIDRYGVLSAVMSMNPRTEFSLFISQVGLMIGLVGIIFSSIAMALAYGRWQFIYFGSSTVLLAGFIAFIISTVKMVRIIRQYKLGFSSMIFLSLNWFFIRSANRNNFFIITFLVASFVANFTLAFLLPYSGVMLFFSLEWYELIIATIATGLLSLGFFIRAKKKADQQEEIAYEQ